MHYAPIDEDYGRDDEDLLCPDSSQVDIPDTVPITTADLDELPVLVNPMRDSDCCGVDIYLEVIHYN